MIRIYTDGAAQGNPGPGGYGVILKYKDAVKELSHGFRLTTNNRMELLAVISGLEAIKKEGIAVTIYSDSKYVVDAIEKDGSGGGRRRILPKKRMPIYGSVIFRFINGTNQNLSGYVDMPDMLKMKDVISSPCSQRRARDCRWISGMKITEMKLNESLCYLTEYNSN
jgi:ribonuclease HI